MTETYHYKAFISYSHTDNAAGESLLRYLENYRVPKRLVGTTTESGAAIPDRVGHIFRDRDELPAAEDLTAEVKKALTQSEFMIVLCSPAAAASRWVNREIIEFKKLTGERRILSVILSGEPFASNHDAPEQECFPPALRFKLGQNGTLTTTPAEPLAADFRMGGDGQRRGGLKLIAGLLGIGLDKLVERELQRKMRRVMAVTAVSLMSMLGMGLLTYDAITARQQAEQHRKDAEGLIEFMLTDLKDNLEPVGRLDVLDAVGEQVVSYYDRQELDDMSDDALGRRARAFHLLGEIDDAQGDIDSATIRFKAAYQSTATLLALDPLNVNRIFDHSQSAFWMGYAYRFSGNYEAALTSIKEYAALTQQLVSLEDNPEWQLEYAYAESSLGTLLLRQMHMPKSALVHFTTALDLFLVLAADSVDPTAMLKEAADLHAWVADTYQALQDYPQALDQRSRQMALIVELQNQHPDDWDIHRFKSTCLLGKGRIERRMDKLNSALNSFAQSASIIADLTHRDPSNVKWLELSAIIHLFWSDALITTGKTDQAYETIQLAKAIENQLFSENSPTEVQIWEVQVWREIVETKFLMATGQEAEAKERAENIRDRLQQFNSSGITPWKAIRLKDELTTAMTSTSGKITEKGYLDD